MLETFALLLLFPSLGLLWYRSANQTSTSLIARTVILDGWHLLSATLLFLVAVCLVLGLTLLIKTLVA